MQAGRTGGRTGGGGASGSRNKAAPSRSKSREPCEIDPAHYFFGYDSPGVIAHRFEGGRLVEYMHKTNMQPEGVCDILRAGEDSQKSAL